jgi:hypothetical protein
VNKFKDFRDFKIDIALEVLELLPGNTEKIMLAGMRLLSVYCGGLWCEDVIESISLYVKFGIIFRNQE